MTVHPFYKVEVIKLSDIDSFAPSIEHPDRIYLLDIGDGMELGFFVGLRESDVIRVGFHAAKGAKAPSEHVYSPVTMSQQSGDSFVLFSDPTLTLVPNGKLSWYLGTPNINPDDIMEKIVRIILQAAKALYVLVEGSSGGGFTSMRFASRFRNCVAVPKIPQTDLFRYAPGPLEQTLSFAWKGTSYEEIIERYFFRFRIADLYSVPSNNQGNLVHYIQNSGDTIHVINQLNPLILELGGKVDSFSALKGQFAISRPYIGAGHIPMPAEYWKADANIAINRLRNIKPYSSDESYSEKKKYSRPKQNAVRDENIKKHEIPR